jgi:phi13 family phage major tail protein
MKMDQKYGEFVGVDSLYYAPVTVNSASEYVAGTPVYLAPAAEVAAAVAIGKLPTHYDNVPANNYTTEAETVIKSIVANLDAKTLAYLLGKKYDETSGRVFDAGVANPPLVAFGFRYNMGTNGYRYYWYLAGTFAGGEEAAVTKKENVEVKNYELSYTAIPTTKKFTVNGETMPLKRVFGDTADAAFDADGWFTQVQIPGAAPPAVVALSSSVPADEATGISKTTTIVLTFNNKIAQEGISLIDASSGDVVACTKAWDAAGKVLTITPDAALSGTTDYVVAINSVVDVYGQALTATTVFFTTAA